MSQTKTRPQTITPKGVERSSAPILFYFSIPSDFTQGQTDGGLTCTDPFTARLALSPPMAFSRDMELHIVNASIPYSFPNMAPAGIVPGFSAGNNRISISWNGGSRTDYLVPTGLYSVGGLQDALNSIAVTAGWIPAISSPLFLLTGIEATQTVSFEVTPQFLSGGVWPAGATSFDFLNPGALSLNDSMGPIVGFPTTGGGATITVTSNTTTPVTTQAPNEADFALTSAYLLYLSFCANSYNNGVTGQLAYSFSLGAARPNSVFREQPPLKTSAALVASTFSSVDIWFTDQNGVKLPLVYFSSPIAVTAMIANNNADGSV